MLIGELQAVRIALLMSFDELMTHREISHIIWSHSCGQLGRRILQGLVFFAANFADICHKSSETHGLERFVARSEDVVANVVAGQKVCPNYALGIDRIDASLQNCLHGARNRVGS